MRGNQLLKTILFQDEAASLIEVSARVYFDLDLLVGLPSYEEMVLTRLQIVDHERIVVTLNILLLDNFYFLKPILNDDTVNTARQGNLAAIQLIRLGTVPHVSYRNLNRFALNRVYFCGVAPIISLQIG